MMVNIPDNVHPLYSAKTDEKNKASKVLAEFKEELKGRKLHKEKLKGGITVESTNREFIERLKKHIRW